MALIYTRLVSSGVIKERGRYTLKPVHLFLFPYLISVVISDVA